jgi:ankyrin repeat protein
VKQLLDREDVNPDKPDNEGRTPLSWAAWRARVSGEATFGPGRRQPRQAVSVV